MKTILPLFMIMVLALHPPLFAADTGSPAIWQLGVFDRSSNEFLLGEGRGKVAPFIVGKSNPAADWRAFHAIANADSRAIQFSLDKTPESAYRLRIAFLLENASVPAVLVEINGHRGLFYLHPELDYAMGDAHGGHRPVYSHADVAFDFPGSYLQQGGNTITLQPVPTSAQTVPDAAFNYDAIELDRADGTFDLQKASAEIMPTVFYQKKNGRLSELVDVFVRYGAKPVKGSLALDIAGRHDEQPLKGERDFGEERLEFAVPEWQGETLARATVNLNGQPQVLESKVTSKKKWTLYVVPMLHLDVGYTDYQAKVMVVHARDISEAMDFTAQHPEFKYSLDSEMELDQFMKLCSPAEQARAVEAMQKRQLFAPAQYVNEFTAFASGETLIRMLYKGANFSREHNTPLDYANLTDIQSYSWSLPSVLASSGIPYFLAGANDDRGPVLSKGRLHESPFWWEGPDKKKVLVWYSRSYGLVQRLFGLPPLIDAGHETLPIFLQTFETPKYHANAALLYGSQDENKDLYPEQAGLVKQWNDLYAYPHMEYSGFKDALQNIAKQFGDSIPTVRGDGGPYWEDDVASNPLYVAMERSSENRGLSAEKVQTLGALLNPRVMPEKPDLDEMWTNMVLFDEHTAASSLDPDHYGEKITEQYKVKCLYAIRANQLAKSLLQSGLANICHLISAGEDTLVVFNALNWTRDGMVECDLPNNMELVDASSQKAVPVETLVRAKNFRHIEFMAQNVPAVGYKVYLLRRSGRSASDAAMQNTLTLEDQVMLEHGQPKPGGGNEAVDTTSTTLESPFYKIELNPSTGALLSIFDKQLKRELVDTHSPYHFGQYVYVTGGDTGADGKLNGLLQYNKPPPELQIHLAGQGHLVSVRKTFYGWSAKLESSAVNTAKIATEIRLFEGQKKIEFIEDVTKDEVYHREGVYFAFPFAMDHPQFQYEIQNGVVDPARDMMPGACREWFTIQHWVSVQQDGMSGTVMPLDAELVTLGDVTRGTWPSEFGDRKGTIFSAVENNYHQPRSLVDYHVPVQQVHFHFRYVITSAPSTDPVALSRMGWEEMTPIEKNFIEHNDKVWIRPNGLDGKQGSFLQIDDPALVLTAWKPAEDGKGTILRFFDLGGDARKVTVATPLFDISEARQADAVERNLKKLPLLNSHQFSMEVHPHEIITVRLNDISRHSASKPK